MRILVIGGTGFIGSHVVRQLGSAGHEVAVFHRGQTHADFRMSVREILYPMSNLPVQRFPQEVFEFDPEVVVHTYAMGAADAKAAVDAFRGRATRLVLLSSGDVYRAYGRFIGTEIGPIEEGLLSETSPRRTALFPYRERAPSQDALEYWYDKVLAEDAVLSSTDLPATILRLPKVYGPERNANLATVYAYRHHPDWQWTHGYVENVAAAIALAATHAAAGGRVYNVGEAKTPTVAERLSRMPPSTIEPDRASTFDFAQNLAYDTTRLRRELGYRELVPEEEALLSTLNSQV